MPIEFDNLDAIVEKLENLLDADTIKTNMGKACALVEGAARENAPKDTGDLRRSIESKVEVDSGEIRGIVFTPLFYAPYVEFGTGLFAEKGGRKDVPWKYKSDEGDWYTTRGMKPHPYMRPALHENREEIKKILGEGMTK